MQGVVALAHVQARQRPPGAADGVEAAPGQRIQRFHLRQRVARDLRGLLGRAFGDVEQGQSAERQRDALPDLAVPHIGELQRTAAEIAHDAIAPVDRGDHAIGRQLRLAHARQQLDRTAQRALGQSQELRTVGGVTHGGGRQRANVAYFHDVAQDAEPLQRHQRLGDAILRQHAGRGHAAAEAAQHLLVEGRRRRAGQRLIGDEPNRVGPDIDDRHRFSRQASSGFPSQHASVRLQRGERP